MYINIGWSLRCDFLLIESCALLFIGSVTISISVVFFLTPHLVSRWSSAGLLALLSWPTRGSSQRSTWRKWRGRRLLRNAYFRKCARVIVIIRFSRNIFNHYDIYNLLTVDHWEAQCNTETLKKENATEIKAYTSGATKFYIILNWM